MSMRFHQSNWVRFLLCFSLIAAGNGLVSRVFGQRTTVRISVRPEFGHALIEVTCPPRSQWSFVDRYASVLGLGSRIEKFAVFDEAGREVPTQKLAPGQFESTQSAPRVRYEINLSPPVFPSDSAFVSWLTKDRGLLMMSDLLPLLSQHDEDLKASVRVEVPAGYTVYADRSGATKEEFEIDDVARYVVAVGRQSRLMHMKESDLEFDLLADGEWAFTDNEVIDLIHKILRADRQVFGGMPARNARLILFPFPQNANASQWTAQTRGTTVTLLLGKLPSKVGALAQISTPLTHEFFHLWVPNGLALEENYDWFYEGFTVYQASRTAVDLGLLTFPEFLNSIARAYDASMQASALSLIDASRNRFTSGSSSVYARGQVVAFIYDLRLRSASRGKRSLSDVYRRLFQTHSADRSAGKRSDGNEAVTSALSEELGSQNFVGKYVSNPVSIDLATELGLFGLRVEKIGLRTYVSVSDKPSKQQRDLLRDLGYNDATRAGRRK